VVGLTAEPVSPAAPREEKGLYWGYTTRVAPGLKEALEQCPFEVSTSRFSSIMSREFHGHAHTTGEKTGRCLSDWG
jgi:predicted SPOUT superfamily RNA methylase MTH1